MWNRLSLWLLRIRAGNFRLLLPVPMHVLSSLLLSLDDLCEVILPRAGQPNYVHTVRRVLQETFSLPADMPLVSVRTDNVDIDCRKITLLQSTANDGEQGGR